jgi:predicted deacylase
MDEYLDRLRSAVAARGWRLQTLAQVGDYPLLLVQPPRRSGRPRALVAAGFHGEEPAGCWGLLDLLESADDVLEACELSLLPLVNPTGIRAGRRHNDWGENPNNGFCHVVGPPELSREGQFLLDNLELLKGCSHDGFLSLHEDCDATEFYLYTFEQQDSPGDFSEALKEAEEVFFSPMPDGVVEGATVRGGVIFRSCDGSFEDRLFHEGIPYTACTETPGRLDLSLRIEANRRITEAFIRFLAGRRA